MKKFPGITAILEDPKDCQFKFHAVVSGFKGIIKGRMGIPCEEEGVSIVCIAVVGEIDTINSLTGKLGNIPHVSVQTSISKNEV
ncbi:TM1266 family iron-only hydrogenase system putative regulator [Clostridioides difficile]|uniref:TM1266 family iron-only hydrogenase system putative regulator n=1 Tax=Clostridioides difficile TaxID=1496 RepID=UPI000BB1AF01|nr:TM1266 family iron-only hydrogenase system putative regulator [Clostridioides difficile]PBE83892.1 iron-only hydrogenase system regulator [Clostridioides difficile]